MPNAKIINVYSFDELSDSAKDNARQWWREGLEFDSECFTDWLAEVCNALSIDLDAKKVYWSIGGSGEGSSYCARVNALPLLLAVESNALAVESNALALWAPKLELPAPPKLHRLVRNLIDNDEAAVIANCGASRGYHGEFTLHHEGEWDCLGLDDYRHSRIIAQLDALALWAGSVLDAINDWFFYALRDDYEYQYSDEAVDENITINEYQFDACGHIA